MAIGSVVETDLPRKTELDLDHNSQFSHSNEKKEEKISHGARRMKLWLHLSKWVQTAN